MFNILLAKNRGFCSGVKNAIRIAEKALKKSSTIYTLNDIVHNTHVVNELKKRGLKKVKSFLFIPKGSTILFSAHGVPPSYYKKAKNKKLKIIDATCPLVKKVHHEAQKYISKGYKIIYYGKKNHVEAKGVISDFKKSFYIIEEKKDIKKLPSKLDNVIFLTQTTMDIQESQEILKRLKIKYPNIKQPNKAGICYATFNNQKAVIDLAKKADLILVIGSKHSSNSNRLVERARKEGIPSYLIDSPKDIKKKWLRKDVASLPCEALREAGLRLSIGITAGASAPESIVKQVINHLKQS
ncbi:4-hydroxy-3-methylbut-2-enyl diphosphate reductase [Candidatus Margulisiibacteriota bacterium]